MRNILALSVILVAAAISFAGEADNELAKARARAAVAIEVAKVAEMPCEPMELTLAKLDAAEAIEAAKADLARPERAPTPKKLAAGCSKECTCGCRESGESGECKCVDLSPKVAAPTVRYYRDSRGRLIPVTPQAFDSIPGAGGCYIDAQGRKVCPNAK
jgi:hypothetical protein